MNNSNLNTNNWLTEPLHPLSIWLKISLISIVAVVNKSTPTQPSWAITMALFAALLLTPIGFQQVRKNQSSFKIANDGLAWHLPCAVCLAISFLLNRSTLAGIFALPYATWCMETFLRGIKWEINTVYIATFVTFGFLANAALWLLFDRFGVQPMGFSIWIVILTGVHFHFAGFLLMVCLSLFLYQNPKSLFIKSILFCSIIGIILTATGIITSQLGFDNRIESVAGIWMAISAILAGSVFIYSSFDEKAPTKYLWLFGGICLILAMVLAGFYAMRFVVVLEILTLPFMQAVHGTLNALGFGTLMLLGWAFKIERIK